MVVLSTIPILEQPLVLWRRDTITSTVNADDISMMKDTDGIIIFTSLLKNDGYTVVTVASAAK